MKYLKSFTLYFLLYYFGAAVVLYFFDAELAIFLLGGFVCLVAEGVANHFIPEAKLQRTQDSQVI